MSNKKGFSLLEITVSMGILGGLALGYSKLQVTQERSASKLLTKTETSNIFNTGAKYLLSDLSCTKNLVDTNITLDFSGNTPVDLSQLVNSEGDTVYEVSKKYGVNRNIKLTSLSVKNCDDAAKCTPLDSGGDDSGHIIFNFSFELLGKTLKRNIILEVKTNPANKITECYGITQNSHSSSDVCTAFGGTWDGSNCSGVSGGGGNGTQVITQAAETCTSLGGTMDADSKCINWDLDPGTLTLNGSFTHKGLPFMLKGVYDPMAVGIIPSGTGSRFYFSPEKGAFRAGYINSTQWDEANVGNYSMATGLNTTASGVGSAAMGEQATASGRASTALGLSVTASGDHSFVVGNNSTASGNSSTAYGYNSIASGDYSFALGGTSGGRASIAIKGVASGENSVALGRDTQALGDKSSAIGYFTKALANNSFAIGKGRLSGSTFFTNNVEDSFMMGFRASGGDTLAELFIKDGFVGINTNTVDPSTDFYVNGNAGGVSSWLTSSDRRLKKNITPLKDSLRKILQLRGVSFFWRSKEFPERDFSDKRELGLIAQDVKDILSEVVPRKENDSSMYSVKYAELVPVLVEAIKELNTELDIELQRSSEIQERYQAIVETMKRP